MGDSFFYFKQFRVMHRKSIMKVGTDGVLLGAYIDCGRARRILDIGTGTGLLCLMLAQKSQAEIHGIDINAEAVEVAWANVADSKWSDRISIFLSQVQNFSADEKYDLIVSNPPFYTTDVVAPEKGRALARHDISLDYVQLVEAVDRLLLDDGRCYVIYPSDLCELFECEARRRKLYAKSRLLISSRLGLAPIRTIVELVRYECPTREEVICIENNSRHDYSDRYKEITRDYYLKF